MTSPSVGVATLARPYAAPAPAAQPPVLGRATRVAAALLLVGALLVSTLEAVRALGTDPDRSLIVDFHPFHLVGRMAWEGHFARSYDMPLMRELERAMNGGRPGFLPFVYPPLYGLVMAPFGLLPVGAAFFLFAGLTCALYLAVLRRLAGPWFWCSVLAVGPVLLIDVRLGQNGLLTAALAGLAADLSLRHRGGWAGLAAGALAFKPQGATLLPLLFLQRRDRRALASAAVTAVGLTALSVAVLGRDTVPGFLAAGAFVSEFMAAGSFPVHRMTSIYACALSLGAPARVALALHGAVAVAVVAATAATAHRLGSGAPGAAEPRVTDPRAAAGVTLMATAFVSPYFFDYDLAVFGLGLALALPGLALRLSMRRLAGLLMAVCAAGGIGFVFVIVVALDERLRLSLGGPLLLACFAVMLATLREPARPHPGAKG